MRRAFKSLIVSSAVALLVSSFAITGCHRSPNEQELQALEEARKAALAAEQKQADCQDQRSSLEKELAQAKQKLQDMQQEKQAVTQRLANF